MSIIVIRTIFLYICIVVALRIMGKRQLGELQPTELVVTIIVSNIATLSIEDTNVPLLGSILPIFTLVSCEVFVSLIILKSAKARKVISGNPCIVVREGVIDQQEMKNLRWSIDDLMEKMRQNNIFDISEVSLAVVETSGSLSTYFKFSARPATAQMLNLPQEGEPDAPPIVVISDGEVNTEALSYCNLRREWLDKTLKEKGVSAEDVFFMMCDRRARYNLQIREETKH